VNVDKPNELQLDALREVANIGCGNAANALAQLVGGHVVTVEVPSVLTAPTTELAPLLGGEAPIVAASLDVEGQLSGRLLLVWSESDARMLTKLLLRGHPTEGPLLEEPRRSALAEVANILGSACLSAIARLTRQRIMPSTPKMMLQPADEVVEQLDGAVFARAAVVLQARFITECVPPLTGQMLLVPDRQSLPRLLGALGL
jgi:chemotaxis protein CheC